jgi:hypothetical protein
LPAHGEDVAQSAIENNFGRRSRIRARQHRGKRMLPLGHLGAPLSRLIRMIQLAGNESLIALEQEFHSLLSAHRRLVKSGNDRASRGD